MGQKREGLLRDPPGERFQRRHARLRRRRETGGPLRLLRLFGGAVISLLGLVLVPLPGPGILIVLAGAALMAGESGRLARRLDRTELWLRERLPGRRR